ncbi:selenium binding protein [Alistipes putredinis]|uniref:selenium binding protein n=1 Tax=Alistipes putredinis TaxID=28117 RepID=UPI003AB54FF0
MYENYTRQSLPTKEYRELLGSAICVFNSNNSFIIENILREDGGRNYSWYDLIDKTSGQLKAAINDTITTKAGSEIAQIFSDLVDKRNRIIHSFQITNDDKEHFLATKDKQHNQFVITKEYLLDFIKGNEVLSDKLYTFRGY